MFWAVAANPVFVKKWRETHENDTLRDMREEAGRKEPGEQQKGQMPVLWQGALVYEVGC